MSLDSEHAAPRVLIKHREHEVRELNSVIQEVYRVVLRIKHLECVASHRHDLAVKDVRLKDLGVALVLLTVRRGHVANDVQVLCHVLETCMELRVGHGVLLRAGLPAHLGPKLTVEEF